MMRKTLTGLQNLYTTYGLCFFVKGRPTANSILQIVDAVQNTAPLITLNASASDFWQFLEVRGLVYQK